MIIVVIRQDNEWYECELTIRPKITNGRLAADVTTAGGDAVTADATVTVRTAHLHANSNQLTQGKRLAACCKTKHKIRTLCPSTE